MLTAPIASTGDPPLPSVQHDAEAPGPDLQWFIFGGCWTPLIQVHCEALLGQVDGTQGACRRTQQCRAGAQRLPSAYC